MLIQFSKNNTHQAITGCKNSSFKIKKQVAFIFFHKYLHLNNLKKSVTK